MKAWKHEITWGIKWKMFTRLDFSSIPDTRLSFQGRKVMGGEPGGL